MGKKSLSAATAAILLISSLFSLFVGPVAVLAEDGKAPHSNQLTLSGINFGLGENQNISSLNRLLPAGNIAGSNQNYGDLRPNSLVPAGVLFSSSDKLSVGRMKDDLTPLYRIWKMRKFLDNYDSPLASESAKFVEVSREYDLDWRFLVSISGIESTFGKFIPYRSYNPFGFGSGQSVFGSFDESIETVGRYLYEMKKKGLDTPEKLAPIYTPPNFQNWTAAVNYFMEKLDSTKL